ncbi:DUF4398 domain-containing protein [Polyangium aurulentum]|uniref:DUF4398 domain-containing protein n=1 Tax=Polyangium aurulentum TaxID=2567896 RepID=UPI0010AEBB14|nr:DUF4398 domain-containing protein [Polyangium aurulentum]UQA58052.1 DUF4398 domain-containing protein [Polyangium aurulentum]
MKRWNVGSSCRWIFAAVLSLAGCGGAAVPSPELAAARVEISRARWSPLAERALPELSEAEEALAQAEAEHLRRPGSAAERDAAYVARRKAERARISGLYAADLEALHRARRSVERLRATRAEPKESVPEGVAASR